ncbi:hypothetical protein [Streptomyces sp. AM6-12]|uniref:hypothetical protein n=1 Tax=Streptomyces sp. AM6-12 TaxID=3345149 RepID=UPI00379BE81B
MTIVDAGRGRLAGSHDLAEGTEAGCLPGLPDRAGQPGACNMDTDAGERPGTVNGSDIRPHTPGTDRLDDLRDLAALVAEKLKLLLSAQRTVAAERARRSDVERAFFEVREPAAGGLVASHWPAAGAPGLRPARGPNRGTGLRDRRTAHRPSVKDGLVKARAPHGAILDQERLARHLARRARPLPAAWTASCPSLYSLHHPTRRTGD